MTILFAIKGDTFQIHYGSEFYILDLSLFIKYHHDLDLMKIISLQFLSQCLTKVIASFLRVCNGAILVFPIQCALFLELSCL